MAGTAHLAVHELVDVHDAHAQPRRHVVVVRQEEQLLVVHRLQLRSSVRCVVQQAALVLLLVFYPQSLFPQKPGASAFAH